MGSNLFASSAGSETTTFDPNYRPAYDDKWAVGKCLRPVGIHATNQHFCLGQARSELAKSLIQAINHSSIPISTLDVLRIGDATLPAADLPVKLLLTLHREVEWDQGMKIARRCHQLLQDFNILDVHCEVVEASVQNCNSIILRDDSAYLWPMDAQWRYHWSEPLRQFTHLLGQPITSDSYPSSQGSIGCRVRLSITPNSQSSEKDEKATAIRLNGMLTCRHPIMRDNNFAMIKPVITAERMIGPSRKGQRIKVMLPSTSYEPVIEQLTAKTKQVGAYINSLGERLEQCQPNAKESEAERMALRRQQTAAELEQSSLTSAIQWCQNPRSNTYIGSIIASPAICPYKAADGVMFQRDWALVGCNRFKSYLADGSPLDNWVCIDGLPHRFKARLQETGQAFTHDGLEGDALMDAHLIRLTKYIAAPSLAKLLAKMKSLKRQIYAFKYGQVTKITHGHINENASYTWKYGNSVSDNIAILAPDRISPFSAPGDSGSLVSILYEPDDGPKVSVAIGILWGGAASTGKGFSMAYATPLQYVFDDITQLISKDLRAEVQIENWETWEPPT
ncbi:hypothetical protein F5Y08DRAFT_300127 [Xylaria arbuscula]|nr:hypothetical protein F5Y08DRAFT_300127 [Xylaria arbuscula]